MAGRDPALPCVVVADPPLAAVTTRRLLEGEFRLVEAHAYESAVKALRQDRVDVLIVGYHFDGLRPYRLIRHVREDLDIRTPILMVQAYPVERGSSADAEVRRAYQALGVRDFVSLPAMIERLGDSEASRELVGIVRGLLNSSARPQASG